MFLLIVLALLYFNHLTLPLLDSLKLDFPEFVRDDGNIVVLSVVHDKDPCDLSESIDDWDV